MRDAGSAGAQAPVDHALLHRADWRFLLPDPQPGTVCVQAHGRLASAAATLASVRRVAQGDATLVVACDPSDRALAAAAAALGDAGVHYAEWALTRHGTVERVLGRLGAAGFRRVRTYWPWPSPDRARVWLAAIPEAVAWYFASAPRPARHPLRRLQWGVRCRAARLAFGRGHLGVLVTVACRDADPVPAWLAAAQAGLLAGGASPGRSRVWGLVTVGERAENRVLGMAGVEGGPAPAVVVKLARVPAAERRLRLEHDALRRLPPAEHRAPVRAPRALHFGDAAGTACAVESFAAGDQLDARLRRHSLPEQLRRATDWTIALARDTGGAGPRRCRVDEMEQLLERTARAFAPVLDRDLVGRTRRLLRACGPLPVVCEHRDLAPWNVLVHGGRWTVVDWEVAEPRGFPLLDLLYFAAVTVCSLRGTTAGVRSRATYEALLDPRSAEGRLRAEAIGRYARALSLPAESVRALRALHWPLHCMSEHARLLDDHGTLTVAALRRSLLVPLWAAELVALDRAAGPLEGPAQNSVA